MSEASAAETARIKPETIADEACFVAGTLVHTRAGLVPIEKIQVGDWVLSQPEGQGERVYKRVVKTFAHENQEIYSVDFAIGEKIGSLLVTGNHPIFVPGKGWTPAERLLYPALLELHDGTTCKVFNLSPVIRTATPDVGWIQGGYGVYDSDEEFGRAIDLRNQSIRIDYEASNRVRNDSIEPTRENHLRTRVYNLEVEDCHTYYVGELGVWVHNKYEQPTQAALE